MAGGGEEKFREHEEYLELKAVFTAIEEFLRGVIPMVKDLIDTMLKPLDGSRLGKDIAELYRQLKESGMSDEMIEKIVDTYLKKRLEEVPTVTSLLKMIGEAVSRGREGVERLARVAREYAAKKEREGGEAAPSEESGDREGREGEAG